MRTEARSFASQWGWPLAVVVVFHLGLAAVPLHFSQASGEESPRINLTLSPVVEEAPVIEETVAAEEPPPPVEEPPPAVEPPPVVEPPPMVVEEPVPQRESALAVVEEIPEVVEEVPELIEEEIEYVEAEEPVDEPLTERLAALDELLPIERSLERAPLPAPVVDERAREAVDWQGYGRAVMSAVHAEKRYPRMAARRGDEGDATVRIVIRRDGTLARAPELVDSTSHRSLDREVLRMVETAAPFESFPGMSDEDEQEFVIPVRFRLEG